MTGFWAGAWLHEGPEGTYAADGKRAIVRRSRFGPLETRIWYRSEDGQYSCELRIMEGLQAEDAFIDPVSESEMLSVLNTELALCQKYGGGAELAASLQAEKERLENDTP